MATYNVTDPETGRTVQLTGDSPPTEQELELIFSQLPAPARKPQSESNPFVGAIRTAVSAVAGDATEDLPNVNQAGMDNFDTARASMLGDDRAYADAVERSGNRVVEDENGNLVAISPDGKRAYVNQPGLDAEDIVRFGGQMAAYVPGAKVLQGLPLIPRILAGGAAAGATNTGLQVLSGREEIDPAQIAITSASGGLAESAAPLITKGARAIHGLFSGQPTAKEGAQILLAAGAPRETVDALDDSILLRVAQQGRHISEKVTPEGAIAAAQGYHPTPAQQTDNLWSQHELARQTDEGRALYNEQVGLAQSNVDSFAQQIGGQGPRSAHDAGVDAMEGLGREAARRKGAVDDAYEAAGKAGDGGVRPEGFAGLVQRVNSWAQKEKVTGSQAKRDLYPGAHSALEDFQRIADDLAELSASGKNFRAEFDELESVRRSLLEDWNAVRKSNPSDARKIKGLVNEFDAWYEDVFDRGLIEGNQEFLDSMKHARGLYADYKKNFAQRFQKKGSDRIGGMIEQFTNGDLSADQAVEAFLGMGQINSSTAREFANRVRGVMPKESWDSFREAAFRRLIENRKTGQELTLPALVNNLDSALEGSNSTLFRTLLSDAERKKLRGTVLGMKGLLPRSPAGKKDAASSGTAERLLRFAQDRLGAIPVLGGVLDSLENAGRRRFANARLLERNPQLPPAAAAAAGAPPLIDAALSE